MIELYFETGRGDMGIPGICICSLIKKNYALAIDGTVPYHHCSILSVFFLYHSQNGTCYTAQECSQRGGSNAGTCALGYGTCCTCEFVYLFFFFGHTVTFSWKFISHTMH